MRLRGDRSTQIQPFTRRARFDSLRTLAQGRWNWCLQPGTRQLIDAPSMPHPMAVHTCGGRGGEGS
eukprot:3641338-Pyramimonas_sp.AAC.1